MSVATQSIVRALAQLQSRYYRLLLLVGSVGSGKSYILRDCHRVTGSTYINLNQWLSQHLLEIPIRHRPSQVERRLRRILDKPSPLLIDHIELLFEPELELDPLRALKSLSRHATLVVAWPGVVVDGYMTYAVTGHPHHRRYTAREWDDVIVVPISSGSEV
jgi:hypothetical protein